MKKNKDKEKVKQLIDQAMKGLEESGRIESTNRGLTAANEPPKSTAVQNSLESNSKNSLTDIASALEK